MGIDREAWLAAMRAATDAPLPPSDALTIRELADLAGMSRVQIWRRMELMIKAGTAAKTTKLIRTSTTGVLAVPAYRLSGGRHDADAHGSGNARRVSDDRSRARTRRRANGRAR